MTKHLANKFKKPPEMSFQYRVNQVQHESNISIIEDLEELDSARCSKLLKRK